MILSVTFSKPSSNVKEVLSNDYIKIKAKLVNSSSGTAYFLEMFTQKQVFHKHLSPEELNNFIQEHAGITFKNCIIRTETEETTILANKKGKITKLSKSLQNNTSYGINNVLKNSGIKTEDFKKNYILQEGTNIPFLQILGIMNENGKIISQRYDKFRQINRFLEFIDDIIDSVKEKTQNKELRIIDFGCGKSYLTFAVQYYLTQIKKVPCIIEGLDLKQDVIDYCNDIAKKLNLSNLSFRTGDISTYNSQNTPDLIITLHACDTATDYALQYAVSHNATAILSVPCCQHQINTQLSKNNTELCGDFEGLLKWGFIREKFSSLLTDALRGQWLESKGYKVQMLEFIDEEHTPKNLLIRAIKKDSKFSETKTELPEIINTLKISPEIWKDVLK